jgi:hypothetical protein
MFDFIDVLAALPVSVLVALTTTTLLFSIGLIGLYDPRGKAE